jgi:hypothetical protein
MEFNLADFLSTKPNLCTVSAGWFSFFIKNEYTAFCIEVGLKKDSAINFTEIIRIKKGYFNI